MTLQSNPVHEFLHKKPINRQQISAWVSFFLGYTAQSICRCIPKNDREKAEWAKEDRTQHQSQLDYLESSFLNLHSACVFMATRNGGKSLAAAVVNILHCWFKPGIKIAVVGFIDDHAQYIARYINKFLDHFEKVIGFKVVPSRSNAKTIKEIVFSNGSIIRFFSGGKSEADVSGFRPNVMQIDEADQFESQKFDGIANALEGGGDIQSLFEVLSTNYTMDGDGVILKQIERYEKFNATKPDHMKPCKVFRLCLLDILANCDDRFECDKCQLWSYCKGKAKEIKTDGYYRVEEAVAKAINTSRPNFEAEFLLLRPSSEFSYFPEFSIGTHVLDPDRVFDPTLLTFIAFDFGHGRCPHAAVAARMTTAAIPFSHLNSICNCWCSTGTISRKATASPRKKTPRTSCGTLCTRIAIAAATAR